ncbi:Aste57867_16892 [Aphanomyces stellatus]|uniref:Aste57867_16892 protein n=1 Tax=Aphanomyces stellatus TaxID=120398 RepID=A0A485L7F0_9STRA|nr:hypothetical protein As57867_016834 [Aphanomyces stellatus]VFT93655.1 Aste57867_16892 [Aphanomyces stellatus]
MPPKPTPPAAGAASGKKSPTKATTTVSPGKAKPATKDKTSTTLPKINTSKGGGTSSSPAKGGKTSNEGGSGDGGSLTRMPSLDAKVGELTEVEQAIAVAAAEKQVQDDAAVAKAAADEAAATKAATDEAKRVEDEAAAALLSKKQNGQVTLKYEMYSEQFAIANGSMVAAAIDDAYCLSFVMPQCLIHLSLHDPPTKLELETAGQRNLFVYENPLGTYHGLDADSTYYVYIEQEADQLARDQARMREIAATMEGANRGKPMKMDDGRGFESCSCVEGNPCVDEYGCKDWHNRFAIATKNGWKGF